MPTLNFVRKVPKEVRHYGHPKTDKTTASNNFRSEARMRVSDGFLSALKRGDSSSWAEVEVWLEARAVPADVYFCQVCEGRDKTFHRDRGGFPVLRKLRVKEKEEDEDEDEEEDNED